VRGARVDTSVRGPALAVDRDRGTLRDPRESPQRAGLGVTLLALVAGTALRGVGRTQTIPQPREEAHRSPLEQSLEAS
jgi:hypothetical protein